MVAAFQSGTGSLFCRQLIKLFESEVMIISRAGLAKAKKIASRAAIASAAIGEGANTFKALPKIKLPFQSLAIAAIPLDSEFWCYEASVFIRIVFGGGGVQGVVRGVPLPRRRETGVEK